MQTKIRALAAALSLLAIACTDSTAPEERPSAAPGGKIRVSVGAAPGIEALSRTQIDPDGTGVRWMPGDRIALWAVGSRQQTVLDAEPFELLHYAADFCSARFAADITPMEEDTYTYYAVSPAPAAAEGTKARFDIPATQNGSRQLACDVMVAAPVAGGGALTAGDNSEALSLTFSHKMHVLKIHIPANRMEEPVERLTLTFPVPVTGRLTVDAADPDAAPTLEAGEANRTLTLDFDTPQDAGATVFAVIAPVELAPEQEIEIKAYAAAYESVAARMPGRNFRAGHTTPVNLTIPERHLITRIFFSLAGRDGATDLAEDLAGGYGCSTLGEGVESFTVTDAQTGETLADFPAADAGNRYEISFEGAFEDRLSGRDVLVTFTSPHARVAKRFTLPQIEAYASNTVAPFAVPYLFEEDFSGVSDLSNHDNAGGGTTIDTYTDAISLETIGLPGWSATRVGAAAGKALRICVRTEDAWIACPRYHGRVDTAPLAAIREPVRVKVSFNYSMHTSWDKHTPLAAWGCHTTQGLINSENSSSTALSDPVKSGITGSGGNYDAIGQYEEYTIENCTADTRLAWDIYSTGRKTGNSNGWLYIDNIRVSIAH